MNCREVLGSLSDYLDQEAVSQVCKELEAHLLECPHCRLEVNTLKRTIEMYKKMPSRCVPGHIEEKLFKVLKYDLKID